MEYCLKLGLVDVIVRVSNGNLGLGGQRMILVITPIGEIIIKVAKQK
jgi:hypothetical protein